MKPVPRSPSTTPLSGSARETELRIRSIFQWNRQRPPLWAMVLIGLAGVMIFVLGMLYGDRLERAVLKRLGKE